MPDINHCPHCGKVYEVGDWPFPCNGGQGHRPGSFWQGNAQIHASEKVAVYENKYTGEIRIPGRADRPVPAKYAAEGYERKLLDTVSDVRRVEKKTRTIHEAGNYTSHSSQELKDTGAMDTGS